MRSIELDGGVIIVALVGNAAEHSTAVIVARKNRIDLSRGALLLAVYLILARAFYFLR